MSTKDLPLPPHRAIADNKKGRDGWPGACQPPRGARETERRTDVGSMRRGQAAT
jgi:hypothetical protein